MKDIIQRLLGKGGGPAAPPAAPQLTLAAFGKHPGWNDYLGTGMDTGIGVTTEALAHVKRALHSDGIRGQMESGAWEKLEPVKLLEGYDHTFLWLREGHAILGRLWSSTDGVGRGRKYPMIVCVDGEGVTPGFMVAKVRPELERLREACRAAITADQVTAECHATQERLRASLTGSGEQPSEPNPRVEARRDFLERPELGPDRLGLLRVMHELGSASGHPAGGGLEPGTVADLRPRHLRLPLASDLRPEALLLWSAFLRCVLHEKLPLLSISRSGVDWLDVIISEPTSDDFFCLQASPQALPLATQIPYELAAELKTRLQEGETKFLCVGPRPTVPESKCRPISKNGLPPPVGNGTGFRETVAGRKGGGSGKLLAGGALLLTVVAGLWFFRGGHGSAPAISPVASNTGSVSAQVEPAAVAHHPQMQTPPKAGSDATAAEAARLKAKAEEKRLEEQKAQADADAKSREAARLKADAEAERVAEERRLAEVKAEAEQAARAREETRLKAQAEAKRVAEAQRLVEVKAGQERDYRSATNYFASGDYSEALKLCQAHAGITPFDTLAQNLAAERKALNQAAQEFLTGDYSFIGRLKSQSYSGKGPFVALLNRAAEEQRILGALEAAEQTNGWQYVRSVLAEPSSAGFAGKKPFAERRQWAESRAAEEAKQLELVKLTNDYETLLVWFRLLKPRDAKSPRAQREQPIEGIIDGKLKNRLLANVDRLEQEFGARGLLDHYDRGKNLKKLRKEINSH